MLVGIVLTVLTEAPFAHMQPIYKAQKPAADHPVLKKQLMVTAARKGAHGKAPVPCAPAANHPVPRKQLMVTAARKGAHGKAPVPKAPPAKSDLKSKPAANQTPPSAAASGAADAAAAVAAVAGQPHGQKRGRPAKATSAAAKPAAEPVLEAAGGDAAAAESIGANQAGIVAASKAARTDGTQDNVAKKRGRPAKSDAPAAPGVSAPDAVGAPSAVPADQGQALMGADAVWANAPAEAAAVASPKPANDRKCRAQKLAAATALVETAKSADIDMIDAHPSICGDAADGAQPISLPVAAPQAPVTSPAKPVARGRSKRKVEALASEPADSGAAPKRQARGRQAAAAAAMDVPAQDGPLMNQGAGVEEGSTAGGAKRRGAPKPAVSSGPCTDAQAEVPMQAGAASAAPTAEAMKMDVPAEDAPTRATPRPRAAASNATASAEDAVEGAAPSAAAAADVDEEPAAEAAATAEGATRKPTQGAKKALAPKGGIKKPATRKGRAARGDTSVRDDIQISLADNAPAAFASSDGLAVKEDAPAAGHESEEGVPGEDFVPPTLQKQPGMREVRPHFLMVACWHELLSLRAMWSVHARLYLTCKAFVNPGCGPAWLLLRPDTPACTMNVLSASMNMLSASMNVLPASLNVLSA